MDKEMEAFEKMKILKPFSVKKVHFQNRVVMAPMVPFGLLTNENGTMSSEVYNHYSLRAFNDLGLMISQTLSVTSKIKTDGGVGIFSEVHIEGLKKLTDLCHSHGTRFFAQIGYPGTAYCNGGSINELSAQELEEIRNEFIEAIRIAQMAGCDGVELHGAHGFFLNMITSPLSNKRNDQYGGSIQGRLLLIEEIINNIKNLLNDNFIISYRMGINNDIDLDILTAKKMEEIGLDMLHISSGISHNEKQNRPTDFIFNEIVFTASIIKKNVNIPIIAVNDTRTINRGNMLISNGLCDFVAYGKPFLANELFFLKSINNFDFAPCFRCKKCKWFVNGSKCPAYKQTFSKL